MRFRPSNKKNKNCFQTALYGRLSDEDKDKVHKYMESESIKNQRDYLHYAVEQLNKEKGAIPIEIYGEYFDDDYTGITFERPNFQKMMSEVRKGNIDCIIVKDFSRFGRDYIRINQYLEEDFEHRNHEVRFIAYSDKYDSLKDTPSIGERMMLFINEEFSRNQSHKISTAMKSKMRVGKFVGAFAPYGYLKDPSDKNHLIIDEEVAHVVKEIFRMNLYEGLGISEIAKRFNERGIDPPSVYNKKKGSKHQSPNKINSTDYWKTDTIHHILKDEKYTGIMVQSKTKRKNLKTKAKVSVPRNEWIRVLDTHEPIISKEDFEAVQVLHKNISRNKNKNPNVSIFAGILKCGDCGHALIKNNEKYKESIYVSYLCRTHKSDSSRCYSNRIYHNKLSEIILHDLNKVIASIKDLEEALKSYKNRELAKQRRKEILAIINRKQEERRNYQDIINGAEEKWLLNKLDDNRYEQIKRKYIQEVQILECDIDRLHNTLENTVDVLLNPWVKSLLKKGYVERLTREMVVEAVDSISIYHDDRLEINYKFIEELEVLFSGNEV